MAINACAGCSFTAINKLNEELKVEGYLQPNPDFNPRAKDAKTREYIFNDSTEQLQRLRREYQDPTIHIAHLVSVIYANRPKTAY